MDAVIAISEAIRRDSVEQAVVIGNPYRSGLFRVIPEIPRENSVAFLGRLVSDKGADLLIRAFAEVTVARARALVCVVTSGTAAARELLPRALGALAAEGHAVELISMGASAINVSVVLPDAQVDGAVRALHRGLFAGAVG